jgi:hypothetical protein
MKNVHLALTNLESPLRSQLDNLQKDVKVAQAEANENLRYLKTFDGSCAWMMF